MIQGAQTDLYMDMNQFSDLKLSARNKEAGAAKAAAQQFEGLFIQMMLKTMRAAAVMDESQHSSNMDFYNDMHDKQISVMMAKRGGIGIANMMQHQLGDFDDDGQTNAAIEGKDLPAYRLPGATQTQLPIAAMNYIAQNPAVKTHELATHHPVTSKTKSESKAGLGAQVEQVSVTKMTETPKPGLTSQTFEPFYGWSNASTFVNDLWPHAEKAAARLGVSAKVLVAQSALETGWGKHAMKKPDGSVAFNLFGIKARSDWAGQSVQHNTLEFRNGAMQQESAHFRAYDSVSDSLDGYVSFVQSSPRYAEALQHKGSDAHYIQNLHRAGYATDPNYADKVLNIISGRTFNDALASIQQHEMRQEA